MKRLLTAILIALLAICSLVAFAACGEHTHNLQHVEANSAFCTKAGNIEYWYCTECHKCFADSNAENYITNTVVPATGHSYGEWSESLKPTCTQRGSFSRTCSVCNNVETQPIPATGHSYGDWTVTLEPTCLAEGSHYRTCFVCDNVDTQPIPATGHSYGDWTVTLEPTCLAEGSHYRTCSVCDNVDTQPIPATGHSYGDWTVTLEPTCLAEGSHYRTCSVCDNVDTQPIPTTGHLHSENGVCTDCGTQQLSYLYTQYDYVMIGGLSKDGLNSAVIDIPSTYNNLPVAIIDSSAFQGCSNLTNITIPDSVTQIRNSAFQGCSNLTNITIPDSVTYIASSAFQGCGNLTNITIGNGVTYIGSSAFKNTAFYNNESNWVNGVLYIRNYLIAVRETLYGDYQIKTGTITIGVGAFEGCSELTSITIPASVTAINSFAFSGDSKLERFIVSQQNSNYSVQDGILYNKEKTEFISIPHSIKGTVTIPNSVNEIGDSAFSGCSGITSITIPSSVTSIRDRAFMGCSGITSITIPNSVTEIGDSAFSGCRGLTSITVPNSITEIGIGTFEGCSGLTSMTIPNSVTEIGDSAFSECRGLTNITIPNSVTNISRYAFWACDGLTSISYNGTKAEWNDITKGTNWDYNTGDYTVHCTDGDISKSVS